MRRKITLKEAILLFLKKSKYILLPAIIFALLMGAFGFHKGSVAYSNSLKQNSSDYTEKLNKYNDEVKLMSNALNSETSKQDGIRDYLNYSLYMSIDPFKVATCEILFTVGPDSAQTTANYDKYVFTYVSAVKSDVLVQQISKLLNTNTEQKYLDEIVQIALVPDSQNTINLRVQYKDQAAADQIATTVFNYIKAQAAATLGEHKVNVVSKKSYTDYSHDLLLLELDTQNKYDQLSDTILTDTKALQTKLQNKPVQSAVSKNKKYTSALLWFVIGGLFAAAVIYLLVLVRYITSGVIQNTDDIKSIYKFRLIADLTSKRKKKTWFSGLISRLENVPHRKPSYDESLKIIGSALHAEMQKSGPQSPILLTGTIEEDDIRKVAEDIRGIAGNTAEILVKSNTDENYSAKEYSDSKFILLVEKVQQSSIKNANHEILMIEQLGKEIVGMILV